MLSPEDRERLEADNSKTCHELILKLDEQVLELRATMQQAHTIMEGHEQKERLAELANRPPDFPRPQRLF